jgi:hypothetical protein
MGVSLIGDGCLTTACTRCPISVPLMYDALGGG